MDKRSFTLADVAVFYAAFVVFIIGLAVTH